MRDNLRSEDDTFLAADTAEGFQRISDRVAHACYRHGMEINCRKSKIVIVNKTNVGNQPFKINNSTLAIVETVSYLSYSWNRKWENFREIKWQEHIPYDAQKFQHIPQCPDSNQDSEISQCSYIGPKHGHLLIPHVNT